METDTIAAIATAASNSGIGIVRVSGENSVEIVNKIYKDKNNRARLKEYKSHTIHYGFIFDGQEIVDEVMVSIMKKPYSFTTENTVEINCHGGMLVINKILELILTNGARLAEPGEFTKRAFLNGRIDLTEAEAVMDLIASQNELSMRNSVHQLQGSVSSKIKEFREAILYEIAFIESALDDPEHINLDGYPEKLGEKVEVLIVEMKKLLSTFEKGRFMKEGIYTVILGKPNAGKSSLLNKLVRQERAIVTHIPGTTRDILEETIRLREVTLHIVDTAGIRFTEDVVEKIGIERAKQSAENADLILYVIDSSVPFDENDEKIREFLKDKKYIILFHKSDLPAKIRVEEIVERFGQGIEIVKTSVKEENGIEELEAVIKKMFFHGEIRENSEVMITSLRHKESLREALESLLQVRESIHAGMPEDFYSIDLMNAYSSLGKIIGEEVEEDLVNEIFSKFCMGK